MEYSAGLCRLWVVPHPVLGREPILIPRLLAIQLTIRHHGWSLEVRHLRHPLHQRTLCRPHAASSALEGTTMVAAYHQAIIQQYMSRMNEDRLTP